MEKSNKLISYIISSFFQFKIIPMNITSKEILFSNKFPNNIVPSKTTQLNKTKLRGVHGFLFLLFSLLMKENFKPGISLNILEVKRRPNFSLIKTMSIQYTVFLCKIPLINLTITTHPLQFKMKFL